MIGDLDSTMTRISACIVVTESDSGTRICLDLVGNNPMGETHDDRISGT